MQNVTMNWDTENKNLQTLGGGKANKHLSGIYAEVQNTNNGQWAYRVVDLYEAGTVARGFANSDNEAKRLCEPFVVIIYSERH